MSEWTDLCGTCGHPRHRHVHCSDTYPALCTHADPIAVDADDADAMDAVCWCLDFEEPEAAA